MIIFHYQCGRCPNGTANYHTPPPPPFRACDTHTHSASGHLAAITWLLISVIQPTSDACLASDAVAWSGGVGRGVQSGLPQWGRINQLADANEPSPLPQPLPSLLSLAPLCAGSHSTAFPVPLIGGETSGGVGRSEWSCLQRGFIGFSSGQVSKVRQGPG